MKQIHRLTLRLNRRHICEQSDNVRRRECQTVSENETKNEPEIH